MIKIIKNNYLFLILFLILILKEPFYEILSIKENIYNTTLCKLREDDFNKLLEFNNIDIIYDVNYINTIIIYKDIYNYLNEITIRGGIDKNFLNEPVIYDNTLLGTISNVYQNSSKVRLLTNSQSKISVKINNEVGILEYKDNELVVSNLSNYSNISIGDDIYTSGMGNIKENIYIGTVKDIIYTNKDIEKLIKVDYKLDIKKINYVTVLKESI